MDKEKIKKSLESLQGLSYNDWQKVSIAVNNYFERKEREYKRQLTLPSSEITFSVIRELFGDIQG